MSQTKNRHCGGQGSGMLRSAQSIPRTGGWPMRAAFITFFVGLIVVEGVSRAVPPDPHYKLVLQAPPATPVDSVTVSPDGSLVATAAGEGGVRLYDARTGEMLRVIVEAGDRG